MNKETFISDLGKDDLSQSEKIAACQYFIDHYPIKHPAFGWTKLEGYTITGGSEDAVDRGFDGLVGNIEELSRYYD